MVPFRIGLDALKILQESGSVVGWENLHFAWFQSWYDKSQDVKTCLLQVMPLISNDFNDETARSSKRRFDDSRSARPAWLFSRIFFRIEFWGARLGDGVASGAPGDRTSRRPCGRWRGWEALGAVIPRVGGHQGAVLNQWDKSWILTWRHQFPPHKVTRSGGPPLKSANLGTSSSNNSPKVSKWGCHKGQFFRFRKRSNYKPDRIIKKQ